MNKKYFFWIFILFALVCVPNVLGAFTYVNDTFNQTTTLSETAINSLRGVNITFNYDAQIVSVFKYSGSGATRVQVCNTPSCTGVIYGNATFNGLNATFTTPINVSKGSRVMVVVDNFSGSYTSVYNAIPLYPSPRTAFNWTFSIYNNASNSEPHDVQALITRNGTQTTEFNYVNPTPSNNSVQFISNNSFVINTTIAYFGQYNNVTHLVYNSSGSLYFSNTSSNNFSSYITNLSVGRYYFNVSAFNGTNTTYIETRTIYINATNAAINISAKDNNGITINTFNITVTELNTSTLTNYGTTTGNIIINTIQGYEYYILANTTNYAYANTTITQINSSQSYQFTLYPSNSINITLYDETTLALITENATITLTSTNLTTTNYTTTGNILIKNIPENYYAISINTANYSQRIYLANITNTTYTTLNAYLSKNTSLIQIYVTTTTTAPILNAIVQIRKLVGSNYITIAQSLTDENGLSRFNLVEGTSYQIIITASDYTTKQFFQTFYLLNSPYIYKLSSTSSTIYTSAYNFVEYGWTPTISTLEPNNIIFTLSTNSKNGGIINNFTISGLTNTSTVIGSPSGGTASITLNLNNYYGALPINYTLYIDGYDPLIFTNTYYIQPNVTQNGNTSAQNAAEYGHNTLPIVWQYILGMFLTVIFTITAVQLSGRPEAGVFTACASIVAFAIFQWFNPILSGFVVLIIMLLYFYRPGGY